MPTIHDFSVKQMDGDMLALRHFKGKAMLIVNAASGFTPQFAGLEQLHQRYRERKMVVQGFPATGSARRIRAAMPRSRPSCPADTPAPISLNSAHRAA